MSTRDDFSDPETILESAHRGDFCNSQAVSRDLHKHPVYEYAFAFVSHK